MVAFIVSFLPMTSSDSPSFADFFSRASGISLPSASPSSFCSINGAIETFDGCSQSSVCKLESNAASRFGVGSSYASASSFAGVACSDIADVPDNMSSTEVSSTVAFIVSVLPMTSSDSASFADFFSRASGFSSPSVSPSSFCSINGTVETLFFSLYCSGHISCMNFLIISSSLSRANCAFHPSFGLVFMTFGSAFVSAGFE